MNIKKLYKRVDENFEIINYLINKYDGRLISLIKSVYLKAREAGFNDEQALGISGAVVTSFLKE